MGSPIPTARAAGVVSDSRWQVFEKTRRTLEDTTELLRDLKLSPQAWEKYGFDIQRDGIYRRSVAGAPLSSLGILLTFDL